ncbi:MAG: hypothetical protein KatS3mg005_1500 [Bryobacteraceae bacterium]|nr:MAG: hypothetical protein KatS3mg005_1500 [Bryobacteraceae bacterium]
MEISQWFRRSFVLAAAVAALAAYSYHEAGNRRLTADATGPQASERSVPPAVEPPAAKALPPGLAALAARTGLAEEPEEEISADDGSSDGTGVLEDGLMLVARLTPSRYPVRLKRIRLYFTKFRDWPDPQGQKVRLVAFVDPEGKGRPPANPRLAVDQWETIPSIGGFVDFSVDGPLLESGDLYVGYQAPRPHGGVGFPLDTNGAPQERGFWSDNDGAEFFGPLELTNGLRPNPLMRAVVQREASGGEEEELSADDGTVETGLLRDGGMYVNRLTPSRYPARITKLRFYMVSFSGYPSPVDRRIRVVVFADPEAAGRPPDNPAMLVDREVTIPKTGEFLEIPVEGVEIAGGDVYVGYQAPSPHEGVGFALDFDGPAHLRSFRSTNGGSTFTGPLEVTFNGQTRHANLMLRAVADYRTAPPPPAGFSIIADRDEIDLAETDGVEEIRVGVLWPEGGGEKVPLSARTDPPGIPVTMTWSSEETEPDGYSTLRIEGLQQTDQRQFFVEVIGERSGSVATARIAVNCWRLLAAQTLDPSGGVLETSGFRIQAPPGALEQAAAIKVRTGRPPTGFEEYEASEIFEVEGLPETLLKPIEVTVPLRGGPSSRTARQSSSGTVAVIRYARTDPATGTVAPFSLPAPARSSGQSAQVTLLPAKSSLLKRWSIWLLAGYHSAESPSRRFVFFYPQNYTEAVQHLAAVLEKSWDMAVNEQGLSNLPSHLDKTSIQDTGMVLEHFKQIPVTLKQLKACTNGESDGSAIWLNIDLMKSSEDVAPLLPVAAHEFFHVVQAAYGGNSPGKFGERRYGYPWLWLDEAISTWAEGAALGRPDYVPSTVAPGGAGGSSACGGSDNYMYFPRLGLGNYPETRTNQQEYGYGGSMWLTHLARECPDIRIAGDLLKQREPADDPRGLFSRIAGGDDPLIGLWRSFAERFIKGQVYEGRDFPTPELLVPGSSADDFFAFSASSVDSLKYFRWKDAPDLSFRIFRVGFDKVKELPDLTDDVILSVRVQPPDRQIEIHGILYGPEGKEYLGNTTGDREFELPPAASLQQKRARILLLASNNRYAASRGPGASVTLRLDLAEPSVRIKGYTDFTGVIGHEYEFTTVNRNIPSDAQYLWIFDNGTKTGRTVKNSWTTSGVHPVRLQVDLGNKTLEDRLDFRIADPLPPTQKEDVVFEVYRTVKVGNLPAEKQKCNQYQIRISDQQGKVVETGESLGRNGSYETRLPVAFGYRYNVKYVYTNVCADSGEVSGSFDVKGGRINYVPIETPRCEK